MLVTCCLLLVGVDQVGVRRAAHQQLGVRPAVDDPAVGEVDDLVGQPDGGLAVGDDDQGGVGAVGGAAQRAQDPGLDLRVDRRGGVVEDQQPRPADQRPGQGDPLPLAARERGAALPQLGVERVGQGGDEAVALGGAQGCPDVLVGDVGAEGYVVADGVVEEERGLADHGHRAGQLAVRQVAQVGAVDLDRSPVGVDESGQQRGERALARGGGADQRDGAARVDPERDVVKQLLVALVGIGKVLDVEPGAGQAVEARVAVLHLAGGREHRGDPVEPDHAAGELAEQPADRADRERDDGEQVGDGDQAAGVGLAVQHPVDAERQHHEDADVGDGGQRRVEHRADPAGPDRHVTELAGLDGEALGLLALAAEGLATIAPSKTSGAIR